MTSYLTLTEEMEIIAKKIQDLLDNSEIYHLRYDSDEESTICSVPSICSGRLCCIASRVWWRNSWGRKDAQAKNNGAQQASSPNQPRPMWQLRDGSQDYRRSPLA